MTLREKREMETLYGPPGSGDRELSIPTLGEHVSLARVLTWLGVGFGDATPVDGRQLRAGLWVIRYFDRYDQSVYALEFDVTGRVWHEMRAHIEGFVDDEAFYSRFATVMTAY